MSHEALLERARLHVRRWFARRIPKTMCFHDLEHTLTVTRTAKAIGQAMKLAPQDLVLLELAGLFHDTGYALAYAGHEAKSAELATAFLGTTRLPKADISRIRGMILSTRMGAVPRTTLQKVLRDADSAKAGQVDFIEKSELLRKELETVHGKRISPTNWLAENLAYLNGHVFFTRYARDRYGRQKGINLKTLEERTSIPKKERAPLLRPNDRYFDRDLSWLSFNDRVLQEAKDPSVPLLERIKFLAIYSSNLDEFYRVRVASLRSLTKLRKVDRTALEVTPEKRVERINQKALLQQQQFGKIYRGKLLPALADAGIHIVNEKQLTAKQRAFVRSYFSEHVAPLVHTAAVRLGNALFIEDRKLYFACRLEQKSRVKEQMVLVNIPSDVLGRFVLLPSPKGITSVMSLDDVMRVCLAQLFTGYKVTECHSIKLSRDAELYLDEEFVGNMKEKVRKSLRKRTTGVPSRFLYDATMPQKTLRALRNLLGLTKPDLVPGGRYHNFSDLMKLPVKGHADLREPAWPPAKHPTSKEGNDTFNALKKADILWHFPYHDFENVVRWLEKAARDRQVQHIAMTLYRVADDSAVCGALLEALARGKKVTVFVEVQARFDERMNLFWGETLEKAGATVLYSYEHLKVHCKLCMVERREKGRNVRYAYLGTGNFNERTSRIYADMALLTAKPALTKEVAEVFAHLKDRDHRPALTQLLMAPLSLRDRLEALIDKEIERALLGQRAEILLKLNSLEDRSLIRKLYDASSAGVNVRLIVRGICCLVPQVPGSSANIEAISIVDRYLEHTRVYMFHNGGRQLILLSSADWMGRNLDRRVEVAFPVNDPDLQRMVLDLLEIQWNDGPKARIIDTTQSNPYRSKKPRVRDGRSQEATYRYFLSAARKAMRGQAVEKAL